MPDGTRADFDARVHALWANYYDVEVSQHQRPGTSFRVRANYDDHVQFWQIDQHVYVETAQPLMERVKALAQPGRALSGGEVRHAWEKLTPPIHATLDIGHLYYLYPADFQPCPPAANFSLRKLTPSDKGLMDELHAANPEDEADEADVQVAHDHVVGVFHESQLVAAASIYRWRGFIDPGVITHPDFRGRGLGKAVVSALCQHVLSAGLGIMIYRSNTENLGSVGIAKALGFSHYFVNEGLWLDVAD
ncbi:MAG: GNAT family N-acetyltransferase [Chloroflexi bacterium]|nr:GNAT family N-acetyltransferase [Chloroflexota bacterium]